MVVSVGSGTNDMSGGLGASIDIFLGMASMVSLAGNGIHDILVGCDIEDSFEGGCDEHRY